MGWLAAGAGYEVALSDGKVVCRTERGKVLRGIPKTLAEDETVVGLRQLAEWLGRHEAACRAEVDRWLTRSLPVPSAVLAQVWPDEAWRAALNDLVVVAVDAVGGWLVETAGFLRDADPRAGLGVVTLDGESVRLAAAQVALPHPIRLPELDELREFAADLGVRQGTLQLFREIWRRPDDPDERVAALSVHAEGRFDQLRHLTTLAARLGYPVRGGYVVQRVWEDGRPVTATVWAGAGDPGEATETGPLSFVDEAGEALPTESIGPVAWSEGMRMAAGLYAGRVVNGEQA